MYCGPHKPFAVLLYGAVFNAAHCSTCLSALAWLVRSLEKPVSNYVVDEVSIVSRSAQGAAWGAPTVWTPLINIYLITQRVAG